MRVRLTRKLAESVDGVDLSNARVGDVLKLEDFEADLLVAEGWAVPVKGATRGADRSQPDRRHRERVRTHIDDPAEPHHMRRAEDRVRDELRDDRARIIQNINHSIGAVSDPRAELEGLAPTPERLSHWPRPDERSQASNRRRQRQRLRKKR